MACAPPPDEAVKVTDHAAGIFEKSLYGDKTALGGKLKTTEDFRKVQCPRICTCPDDLLLCSYPSVSGIASQLRTLAPR